MNKNKPLLIFDFDGTIVDSLTIGLKIANQLSDKYKYKKIHDLSEIREHSGITFIRKHIAWYYLPFWLMNVKKEVMSHLDDIPLYPSIRETLYKLKENYDLGIIGGGPKQYHRKLLQKLNINIFDFVNSDRAYNKQKKIRKFISKYPQDQIIMVGDDIVDIQAAKKAGIKVIAVSWGATKKEILTEESPDELVERPELLYDKIISMI